MLSPFDAVTAVTAATAFTNVAHLVSLSQVFVKRVASKSGPTGLRRPNDSLRYR